MQKPPIRSRQIQTAEELLHSKRYKESVVALENISANELPQEEKIYLSLLKAEANLYIGDYAIEAYLDECLNYYKHTNCNQEFARAKYLHGWFLLSKGDFFLAREVLQESYAGFLRCDDAYSQARVLNHLSFIAYHVGEIQPAISYLQRSADLYARAGDNINRSSMMRNLAQLYFVLGQIADSIVLYEEMKSTVSDTSTKNACLFYTMSAIPFALRGETAKAKSIIDQVTHYMEDFIREQAIYYENLGWIYLLEEDYSAAEKALIEGLRISLEIAPDSALVSQIKRRLADACLERGQYDRARRYVNEAMAVAEKLNERIEIAACYRIYARLETIDGHKEKAVGYFKKAIDIFSVAGARYELAVTRYVKAISGLCENDKKQALLYLAREYFASENVSPYLKKIDREMGPSVVAAVSSSSSSDIQMPKIVVVNDTVKRLVDMARSVARSDMSVLLTGPTGTGKDLLAQYIHYHSGRSGKFVAVNSAAIPETMIEAELFGHRKGCFTGAEGDRIGLIEAADGGTFYLNEIADSSASFQTKLLDALERKVIRRLGENKERPVDFRLIAATNHDLEKCTKERTFRIDLYHRICEVPIALPPLTERREDIPALVMHFLALSGVDSSGNTNDGILQELMEVLSRREWPGNIRELKAEVKRLVLMSKGDLRHMVELAAQVAIAMPDSDRLLELLEKNRWNRRQVARMLGVSDMTIRRQIKRYNLFPN